MGNNCIPLGLQYWIYNFVCINIVNGFNGMI